MDLKLRLDPHAKKTLGIAAAVMLSALAAVVGVQLAFPDELRLRLIALACALAIAVAAVVWLLVVFVARREAAEAQAAGEKILSAYREGGSRARLLEDCAGYLDAGIALEARIRFMEEVARMLIEEGAGLEARKLVGLMTQRNLLPDGRRKLDEALARLKAQGLSGL